MPAEKDMPICVALEACTLCQLKCAACYMRESPTGYCNVGAGYLRLANFKKFLEMNPSIKWIELSNNGEIFLNPELIGIMEFAASKNVILTARNGVNFNDVSDETLEALVKHRFSQLTISMDGTSQNMYAKYRRGGNFDKVISNIRKLNEYKKKYKSKRPHLNWTYVLLEHNSNLHEVRTAKKMAAELGMYACTFQKAWSGFVPDAEVQKEAGLSYDGTDKMFHFNSAVVKFDTQKHRGYMPCYMLWIKPQINWDGRFLGCASNTHTSFSANAFETGLAAILNSKIVKDTKKMLTGEGICFDSPCLNCTHCHNILKQKRYIDKEELARMGRFNMEYMEWL